MEGKLPRAFRGNPLSIGFIVVYQRVILMSLGCVFRQQFVCVPVSASGVFINGVIDVSRVFINGVIDDRRDRKNSLRK